METQRPAYQKFAVDVQPSTIDGQGAFAAEPIPPRLKIGEIRGESISVAEARIRATRSERPNRRAAYCHIASSLGHCRWPA